MFYYYSLKIFHSLYMLVLIFCKLQNRFNHSANKNYEKLNFNTIIIIATPKLVVIFAIENINVEAISHTMA